MPLSLSVLTLEAEASRFVAVFWGELLLHHLLQKFLQGVWTEGCRGTARWLFWGVLILVQRGCAAVILSVVWSWSVPNPEVSCR